MSEKVKLSKDGSSIDFVQSESLPTSMKKFRQSPEIEGFYRFIYENDLQKEAFDILDRIINSRKSLRDEAKAQAKAIAKEAKSAEKSAAKEAAQKERNNGKAVTRPAGTKHAAPVAAPAKHVAAPAPAPAPKKAVTTKAAHATTKVVQAPKAQPVVIKSAKSSAKPAAAAHAAPAKKAAQPAKTHAKAVPQTKAKKKK